MSTKEKLPFRVMAGGILTPNDGYVARRMGERWFKPGDLVLVTITKTRKPWYNRYAHKIGQLGVRNLPGFDHHDAHEALKRLQWESGAHCEEFGAMVPGVGLARVRIPKSLAYGACSQENYEKAVKVICRHISKEYWPDLTPEQVQEMAETMPDEV